MRRARYREIVRDRWRCVTAETASERAGQRTIRGRHVRQPDFDDVSVGIARTQPAMDAAGRKCGRWNRLFLEFDRYRRAVALHREPVLHVEHRWPSASPGACRRSPQLETLLIGPQNHESWVEAHTMRNGRIRFMRTLAEAGVGERVRLVYPHVEDGEGIDRHDDALQGHDHR